MTVVPFGSACTPASTNVVKTYFKGGLNNNGDKMWASFVKAKDIGAGHYAQQVSRLKQRVE